MWYWRNIAESPSMAGPGMDIDTTSIQLHGRFLAPFCLILSVEIEIGERGLSHVPNSTLQVSLVYHMGHWPLSGWRIAPGGHHPPRLLARSCYAPLHSVCLHTLAHTHNAACSHSTAHTHSTARSHSTACSHSTAHTHSTARSHHPGKAPEGGNAATAKSPAAQRL